MASPEEIRKLLDQLDRAYRRLGETNPFSRQETDVRKLEDALRGVENRLDAINDDFGDIRGSINASLDAMSKTNVVLNNTKKAFRGIDDVAKKLRDDQSGITELNLKDLKTLEKKFQSKVGDLENSKDLLENKKNSLDVEKQSLISQQQQAQNELRSASISVARRRELNKQIRERGREIEKTKEDLRLTNNAYDEASGLLEEQGSLYTIINDKIQARIAEEERVNEALGLGGAAIDGMGKALDKMGLGRLKDALGLDSVKEGMEDLAKKAAATGEEITFKDKLKVLGGGLREAGVQLISNLKDPLVVISAIFDAMIKGSDDIANIQKTLGVDYKSALNLRLELGLAAANSEKLYVTSQDLQKAFSDLTQQTGFIADFGGDTLVSFTTLNKQLGLSEESAGNLALFARAQGENTEDILSNTVATVSAMNKQDRVAVNVKQVLQDISSASKSIAGSLGFSPEALARAARQARKLGLSLSEVDKVAESLLQFESSIEAELEAELLTGKQLNLERARYFALTNDLEGLSNEIAKNEEVVAAFSSQNRIQQEALAKSLGISRDQLAQMALSQKFAAMSAEEFKDAYGETTYEALATQSATEKFQASIAKVQEVLGNIGVILAPIIDGFAAVVGYIAESKILASALVGILAGIAVKSLVTSIASIYQSFLQIPFGAGLPLAIGATAGLLATIGSATAMYGDDIFSPPPGGNGYGKRTLFGPEGSIALNDNDTIIAGTNLGGGKTETASTSPSINIAPLVEQMNRMNTTLQAILAKEGTIELDGTKVGTALTVGSYKLQ